MQPVTGLVTDPGAYVATAVSLTVFLILATIWIALYVYYAIALMTIARKIGTPNAWLAFVPLANIYLTWRMSTTPVWTVLAVFSLIALPVFAIGGFIAFGRGLDMGAAFLLMMLGALLMLFAMLAYTGFMSWWWWRIAERRAYHGAFGLLLTLPVLAGSIPYIGVIFSFVPLVAIGILAWRDQP